MDNSDLFIIFFTKKNMIKDIVMVSLLILLLVLLQPISIMLMLITMLMVSGDMNDWKHHMTVAMNEKFTVKLQERASTCPFSAKYV